MTILILGATGDQGQPLVQKAVAARGVRAILMHLPFTFDRAEARAMGSAIAEGAKAALAASGLPERLLLGGPEMLTGDMVAERLSAAIGRPIRFESRARTNPLAG